MTDEVRAKTEKKYFDRLDEEMAIIVEMGFPGYFLIVAEFIHWANEHSVPVGPGRGRGAGRVAAGPRPFPD